MNEDGHRYLELVGNILDKDGVEEHDNHGTFPVDCRRCGNDETLFVSKDLVAWE